MTRLAFDTLVLHHQRFQSDDLIQTYSFYSQLGIKHFIFTYEWDVECMPASVFFANTKTILQQLRIYRPRGCHCYLAAQPILTKDVMLSQNLSRMRFGHSDYLFLTLPWFVGDDWVPKELNQCLYQRKLKPVFVSFERNILSNSKALIQSISRISSAIYAMDILFLASPNGFSFAEELIQNKMSVIPCASGQLSDYAGLQKSYNRLLETVGSERFQALYCNFYYTKSNLF